MLKLNKNCFLISILFLFFLMPISLVIADDNIQALRPLVGEGVYKFNVLPIDTPLIPSFPIDALKNDPGIKSIEYIIKYNKDYYSDYYLATIDTGYEKDAKIKIYFYIYNSIENARIEMMERISNSSAVFLNAIDYKTDHIIGDNCWFCVQNWKGDSVIEDSRISDIFFLRNNVKIRISNENNYNNPLSVISIAEKVDRALINCEKVSSPNSLKSPVISSFEIIKGSLSTDSGEDFITKTTAIDPSGENLSYRKYGIISNYDDCIINWGRPSVGIHKMIVWVMNESHLITLVIKEVTF